MPIEEHLEPGEVILGSAGMFYATDRRLIRYEPAPFSGPQAQSLQYSQVQEVRPGVQTRYRMVIISLVIFILGLLDPGRLGGGVKLAFMLVGLIGIVFGVLNRKALWEFRSATLDKFHQAQWRLIGDNEDRARRFVQLVQQRMRGPAADATQQPAEGSASAQPGEPPPAGPAAGAS
jgi:hypothetical protein